MLTWLRWRLRDRIKGEEACGKRTSRREFEAVEEKKKVVTEEDEVEGD